MQELKHMFCVRKKKAPYIWISNAYAIKEILYHSLIPQKKLDEKIEYLFISWKTLLVFVGCLPCNHNLPATLTWYLEDLLNHQHQEDQGDQVDPKIKKTWEKISEKKRTVMYEKPLSHLHKFILIEWPGKDLKDLVSTSLGIPWPGSSKPRTALPWTLSGMVQPSGQPVTGPHHCQCKEFLPNI